MRRIYSFHNQRLLGICVLSLVSLMLLSPVSSLAHVANDDLTDVRVAVYNGTGEMESSRSALVNMFEWMGASVEEINASQILGDYLENCDILVFPGGSENSYMIDLQYMTGVEKIQDFINNGGSYFGICGGSTYGAMTVDLFDGYMTPVNEPGEIIHMTTMDINQSSTGPDLSNCPNNMTTMYYASQYFVPYADATVYPVARYERSGYIGMIAFEYGYGTVFLSSPHPEYEEDSDRDNTTFGDDLEDPDSEWDFLLDISKWLVEASINAPPSSTTNSITNVTNDSSTTTISNNATANSLDLPLLVGASVGGGFVILVFATLYQKKQR